LELKIENKYRSKDNKPDRWDGGVGCCIQQE